MIDNVGCTIGKNQQGKRDPLPRYAVVVTAQRQACISAGPCDEKSQCIVCDAAARMFPEHGGKIQSLIDLLMCHSCLSVWHAGCEAQVAVAKGVVPARTGANEPFLCCACKGAV